MMHRFWRAARHASRCTSNQSLRTSPLGLQTYAPALHRRLHSTVEAPSNLVANAYDDMTHFAFRFIDTLHTETGLPWFAILPLLAISLRATVFLPFSVLSNVKESQLYHAAPLVNAWTHAIRERVLLTKPNLDPDAMNKYVRTEVKLKRKEIYKEFGINAMTPYWPTLLQLPVWLLVIETIRKMCGTHEGLLGLITKNFRRGEKDVASIDHTAGLDSPLEPPLRAEVFPEAATQATTNAVIEEVSTSTVPLVESFATEGALWFPNLLVPDPYLYLPFMLSLALWYNITKAFERTANSGEVSRARKGFIRSIKFLALAVGPLTLQLPAAMHLYWLSSAVSLRAQIWVTNQIAPIKRPPKPSKTPPKVYQEYKAKAKNSKGAR